MSRYCLDTSAYSHFKRGHPPVVEIMDSAAWIGVPSIVVGELCVGFLLGHKNNRNRHELAQFLRHPNVEELPVDGAVGELYAEITVGLRRDGTPVPANDIWIAAIASRAGVPVLTYDAHFAVIQRANARVLQFP